MAFLACFGAAPLAVAQAVTVDGTTATTVTLDASGLVRVGIAPAGAGAISQNRYSAFSVPSAGVQLDNSRVKAGTIVNEVTSAKVTTIMGPLTVIGPKADIVLANPNGITVNGGSFQNTGNVALSTGRIDRDDAGRLATLVIGGSIDVGAEGLSGTMEELALISASLRLGGPVQFDANTPAAHLNILAGQGVIVFDRDRGGLGVDGYNILPWALGNGQGRGVADGFVVDITGQASVGAGRISITVTDAGAGVRLAGTQVASSGGFRLNALGHLQVEGGKISAKEGVALGAKSVAFAATSQGRGEVASTESGVVIEARAGNIELGQAKVSGRIVSSDSFASSGGVTLIATGDITAAGSADQRAELVSDAGTIANTQRSSNVVIAAKGAVSFDHLAIDAMDDFRVAAEGAVTFRNVIGKSGANLGLLSSADVGIFGSVLTTTRDFRVEGTALRLGSAIKDEKRTEIKATEGGGVLVSTAGAIENYGSLLQGHSLAASDADAKGGLSIYSAGGFLNQSQSVDRLAVAFGEVDDLYIKTAGDVINQTGRLFSNGGIAIDAGGAILNQTDFTAQTKPVELQTSTGARYAGSLFLRRAKITSVSADYGNEAIAGERSFILGVGDVSLSAQSIENIGADITGANVSLSTAGVFLNEARQVGQIDFSQKCRVFCRTSGFSTLLTYGGTVTASQALSITAQTKVVNFAGSMTGITGLNITAPVTQFVPAFSASLVESPAGLFGLFHGTRGYLQAELSYGMLLSTAGQVTINGDADLGGADILSAGPIKITGTRIEQTRPALPFSSERQPIGLFWGRF